MKVVWSEFALAELAAIRDFISNSSPKYARHTAEKISHRIRQLRNFPHSGGLVSDSSIPSLREILEGNYRIIYRLKDNHVEIVSVLHTSRQFSPDDLNLP